MRGNLVLVTFYRRKHPIELIFFSFLILYYVAEMNCLFCNLYDEKRGSLKLVETVADGFSGFLSKAMTKSHSSSR